MKRNTVIWTATYLILTAGIAAQGMRMGGPCKADRMKHCSHTMGDHGKMLQCMNEHEKDLSPECREHKNAMNADMKSAHAACMHDINKFCAEVKPGQGRMRDCLKKHESEISAACKEAHKNLK